MAGITLRRVTKQFGDVKAVDDVSLDIADGEIVCFLGPSGCGKTTTLRLIAGFERPTAGEVYIGERRASSAKELVPPERRNLGMVFQNYAVWPHMTVFDNVAYPLKLRKVPKAEMRRKVMDTIAMVGLGGLEKRYPEQLSGGQQQRVALARALVVEPDALLLDEPLSNLDAKLREKMRFEIMDLHRRLRVTLVYVTHDQAEAMVLSDRVVIMNQGRVVQVGSPWEIYREPADPFVADFIGLANFVPAVLVEEAGGEGVAEADTPRRPRFRCLVPSRPGRALPANGILFVRPEEVELLPAGEAEVTGTVTRVTFLGARLDVRVEADGAEWRVEAPAGARVREGDRVGLVAQRAIFFDAKGAIDETEPSA
ncbi:MAG: ABC transporter ATP-binding protein [Candidatus Acetothermia bacterium]|jgi:iron(III) transport system ATP-binding protein|nr:ABC transporter ATP-binding protein [Candidatus Acetothermia bacterium]